MANEEITKVKKVSGGKKESTAKKSQTKSKPSAATGKPQRRRLRKKRLQARPWQRKKSLPIKPQSK